MADEQTTRRGYLGLLGALATGLAGCSTTSTDPGQSGETPTATESTDSPQESPYTQVYQETIESVVLIQTGSDTNRGGQGSGFVYRDGYIVTNAHVVSDTSDVQVRFARGQWEDGTVVGTDPSSDLAVVRVQNKPEYAVALPTVGSTPRIGTEVVAIGNPFGLEGSITSGLVSGVNRSIPAPNGYTIPDAVQTSAPVNPGNSGGPLVNLDGEVVGVINSGGGDNLAFAISTALVERVVPALIETGDYEHAYMGVRLAPVTPSDTERIGLDQPRGILVSGVQQGGPSDGVLRSGDVITRVGDTRLQDQQELSAYLALEASPGDTVQFTVIRNGETQTVELTLGVRPDRPTTRPSVG